LTIRLTDSIVDFVEHPDKFVEESPMRKVPEIIKILRKEEKRGLLRANPLSDYEDMEFSADPHQQPGNEGTRFFPEDEDVEYVRSNLHQRNVQEKYQTIFENYAVAITLADEQERIVSWNKYAEELLGMDEQDLFMKPVCSLYPEEEWRKIREENVRQKGMRYKLETKMVKKNHDLLDVEVSLCVLKGAEGKTVGSVGVIKDISRLKATERKLMESETKFRTVFENSAVAITLTDDKERIVSWNKYAEYLLGMTREDLYLKPVASLYPREEWLKIREEKIRDKGTQDRLETKIIRKNKELLDVDVSLSVLKDHQGSVMGSIGIIKDISDRKEIERKLTYEHGLLQSLLDNIPDSIYFKDKAGRFIKVNRAKAAHTDMVPEEMVGKTDFDFLPEDEAREIWEDEKRIMETEEPVVNKIEKITDINEMERWVSVTKTSRYDQNGKVIGTMGISRDITDLKKTNEKLGKSEKKYKDLFETAIDPIVVLDKNGFFVNVNQQVEKILGFSKKELQGKQFHKLEIVSPDYIEKTLENFHRRMRGENIPPYEIKVVAKNGDVIPLEINANPLYEGKEIVGDLVILRDLRERYKRRKIEESLLLSERRFQRIFDASSDFLLYLDGDGVILDINSTALDLCGLKKDQLQEKSFTCLHKIFPRKDMKKHLRVVEQARRGVKIGDYETELKDKHGEIYRFLFSIDIIEEQGDVKGVLVKGRDITQRQKAWNELVKLEEKYRVLAETSADGVITIDPLGRLTYVNPSFEKICGRRKSNILATLFREYLFDDSVYLFQQIFIDARKKGGKIKNVELELVHGDHAIVPVEMNIAPLKKHHKFAGMVCTIRDITERKKIEDELKKSERLKTEFMNIAAHELKSPVTPIKGYLDLIIEDDETSERVKNWARISLRNSEQLLNLVNDILDVSRLDSDTMRLDMEKLNPEDLLKEVVEDMKPSIDKKNLVFIDEISEDLPFLFGDKKRLSQVFKNILGNAVKFTDNGNITVGAKEEKDHLIITVEDTGIGISNDELKKIFSKFYQAYTGDDRNNQGTGLGLFICREIIRKHNGDIWAESTPGKGSKFIMKLPHL
jgi:PAS domain S-box-containing protein